MNKATLAAALLAAFAIQTADADQIPLAQAKAWCASGYVGPRTTYGETKAEAANKKIVFTWTCMSLVEGKADEAFDLYVSKDFCDHSHMITGGLKECASWAETRKMFERMGGMMSKNGTIEFPVAATVNGEMVTQWGAGADIWRVHDGKITDHWDGSPPISITMTAHNQAFSDRMQSQIDTGKLAGGPPPAQ